jgi:hypothetical protein
MSAYWSTSRSGSISAAAPARSEMIRCAVFPSPVRKLADLHAWSRVQVPVHLLGGQPACTGDVALAIFDQRAGVDHRYALLGHQPLQFLQADRRER